MGDLVYTTKLPQCLRFCALVAAVVVYGFAAEAQENTHLVEVRAGSTLSDTARAASRLRYEYSDGQPINMVPWYRSNWTDLKFTFLTELDASTGVYWGFSTGERAGKYHIDPSLTLGFLHVRELSDNWSVSLSLKMRFGGRLRESSCMADYGEIGGVQEVNCRLSTSYLPPSETLPLLWNQAPEGRINASLRFDLKF